MNTVAVKTLKDKIVVTLDKTDQNINIVLRLLERLEIEESSKKINFTQDILKVADEIKRTWWKSNKKRLLKK